jgi:hypothetical protein
MGIDDELSDSEAEDDLAAKTREGAAQARLDRQREEEEREDDAARERIERLLNDLATLSHSDRESLAERLPSDDAQALLRAAAGHLGKGGPLFFLGLARDSLVKWQTGDRKDWTLSFEVEDVMRRVGAENTALEERSQ